MAAREESSGNDDKIADALKLLEEAAVDKKDELRHLIRAKCEHLKGVIMEAESNVSQTLTAAKQKVVMATEKAREVGEEKVKEVAKVVDISVHENPWPYIGGVALGALLLGYILGRKN